MTRPPFGEFSALAIRELTAWIDKNPVWSERLSDVVAEHFLPVVEEAGLDPEKAWETLGEFGGTVYGAALEDLCTRSYEELLENLVGDFLKEVENHEAWRAKETGVGYDARWLWRELGIERLRR